MGATVREIGAGQERTARPRPAWRLLVYVLAGAAAGGALGVVVEPRSGAALACITGALVAGAGASGPSRVALRLAAFMACVSMASVFVAFATAGLPWLAALGMAVIAVLTSVAAGSGRVGAALGALGSLAYLVASVLVISAGVHPGVSLASGALRIVAGAMAGLAVTAVGAALRDRRDREAAAQAPRIPSPWAPMWASLRTFDEHARDGVRRAVPLAVGMYLYQRSGSHDAFWIFLSAFVVLLPTGKSPVGVALARVASTVIGVALLEVLALVAPDSWLVVLGLVALLLSIALSPPYPLLSGGLGAMGAVVLVGAPAGDIGSWAGHRLLDTLIGCVLALASMYLLWPRDKAGDDAAPAGEGEEATA